MADSKIIQDPLYGPIRIQGIFLDLLNTPEFQRLRNIKQLGLCYLVFPEANHTRFSHSLGTFYLLGEIEGIWGRKDLMHEKIAGLLHDIGHTPFSHTFEDIFQKELGKNHEDIGSDIIRGRGRYSDSNVAIVLEKYGIDKDKIASLLKGRHEGSDESLPSLISGPLDMDELDYLRRDAFFCGVPIGNVDFSRLLNTMEFDGSEIYVREKGITALESLYINRFFMYRTVYFHRTVRIASLMIRKALESISAKDISNAAGMDDFQFVSLLMGKATTKRVWTGVQERRIYKTFLQAPYSDNLLRMLEMEARDGKVLDDVIIDVIPPLSFSGSKGLKTTQNVMTGSGMTAISEVSDVVRSLPKVLEHRTIYISGKPEKIERLSRFFSTLIS